MSTAIRLGGDASNAGTVDIEIAAPAVPGSSGASPQEAVVMNSSSRSAPPKAQLVTWGSGA